jgi:hypothetical protein
MYLESAASPHETGTADGINEIAEGLMLLRASTLKIIRLQLAIERHDRHVALEAVDDLVALDRKLQDFIEGAPATRDQVMFRRELDSDRAALNQEKLTLAAEVLRRPMIAIEQDPVEEIEEDWLGPRDVQLEPELPRRSRWWLAITAILLLLLASAAVYLVGAPNAAEWLEQAARAVR